MCTQDTFTKAWEVVIHSSEKNKGKNKTLTATLLRAMAQISPENKFKKTTKTTEIT